MIPLITELWATSQVYSRVIIWLAVFIFSAYAVNLGFALYTGWYDEQIERHAIVTLQSKLAEDYSYYLQQQSTVLQSCFNNYIYDGEAVSKGTENVVSTCLGNTYHFPYHVSLSPVEEEVLHKYCVITFSRFSPILHCQMP